MAKRVFVSILISIMTTFLFAENGLSMKQVEKLAQSVQLEGTNKLIYNAVTNNDINELALDRQVMNQYSTLVNFKLDVKGITNQKSTGRCWMFAALNTIRPLVIEKYELSSFEFSQNYLFFYDKLEKANMFLDEMINLTKEDLMNRDVEELIGDPIPDGGWWNYAVDLIGKYGVVPKEIMPETISSESSRMLNSILSKLLKHNAMELRNLADKGAKKDKLLARKNEMLEDVYRVLVLNLGKPVTEFDWRFENKDKEIRTLHFTPQEFYKEAVGLDLSEYVTVLEHPVYEFNDHYTIEYCRGMSNVPDMDFVNISSGDFKEWTKNALQDSLPVWFAATSGPGMSRENGIMDPNLYDYETLFDIEMTFTKKEALQYGWGIPNHAMVFVGMDLDDNGNVSKWLVENSWGKERGDGGYYTMSSDWFDKFVFNVILPKKYLPENVQQLLKKKTQKIPSWDPMRETFLK
ncbi:MAG: C1 family peptidase [Candidatus Marinimicrobia bacterium]|nr:C1 family peptidase [Candidatus Neomarinimicrobiota bacterium]